MTRDLDGPRLLPRGRTPTALVVLLHGYGANGDDLIALGDALAARAARMRRSWRPTRPRPSPACTAGCSGSRSPARSQRVLARRGGGAPALDRFLDAELARYRLPPERLVLVGFSQGTMMALHVGLRRASAPAGIVAYSGLLAGPEHLGETTAPPADPAHPWRGRRPDSDRGAAHRPRGAGRGRPAGRVARAAGPRPWHRSRGPAHGRCTSSRRCCADESLASARTRKMRDFQAQCANRRRLHIPDTDG